MDASVEFAVDDDARAILYPGDIIGRMRQAALRLNHPSISEAHALVSLRGSSLRLLGLRGRFTIGDARVSELELRPGLEIGLSGAHRLRVVEISLPTWVVALQVPGLGRVIPPPVSSILPASRDLIPGFSPAATAVIWVDGPTVHLSLSGGARQSFGVGSSFTVGETTYTVTPAPIGEAALEATVPALDAAPPVTLVLREESVLVRAGASVTSITGVPGRILTIVAQARARMDWRAVAASLWPAVRDEARLRVHWDAGLARLRRRLRESELREDLVRSAGVGFVELVLGPDDAIVHE